MKLSKSFVCRHCPFWRSRCWSKSSKPSCNRRKKKCLWQNGTEILTLQTRHGTFLFERIRLKQPGGSELPCFFEACSQPLCDLRRFLLNRLSFADAQETLRRFQGEKAVSEDGLWRWVQKQAQQEDAAIALTIAQSAQIAPPPFVAVTDVYASQSEEFVVYTDGICVKSQKPTPEKADQPSKPKIEKRHDTDVMRLPCKDGRGFYLTEGLSEKWSLVEAAQSFLRTEYSGQTLSVIAISDGARSIRQDLSDIFGRGVRVLLDWYHLSKRVYQGLSLSAHGKKERESWEHEVLGHLWRGRVSEAIAFLCGLEPRNRWALEDLIGYVQKHQDEIVDYYLRKQSAKPIGSGPAEKSVDQGVGMRQKDQGMSWTKAGSRALALLKAAELNARPLVA
jgi:hypothetical protein